MKLLLNFILAFCLLTTAGCMVGPDYKPPETKVPEAWNGQEVVTPDTPSKTNLNPADLVGWWNQFKDLTLSSLVDLAIRANLDLRQAEARIRQARAALGVAGAPLYPEVDATLLFQRSSRAPSQLISSPTGVGAVVGPSGLITGPFTQLFQVGGSSSYQIDVFGGIRRNLEAAGADLMASVEDRRDVLVTLVGEVGNNYLSLRGFQQQLAVARKNLVAQKKTAAIIRRRFEAGTVSKLDLANAEAQVATTAAQIPTLESQIRAAIYALGVLLGREPAVLEKDLIKEGPIPPNPPEVPVGLPSELIRRRPDIRRAEAQLHAATARIGVATADLFPKFSLTGSFGISSSDLTKLGNIADNKFWSFGPSVTWPIFAGGRIWWNIKVQDALAEQALLTYQKAVLTALQDVETALVAYAKEQDRRKALVEAVNNNRQAVDLAMKLYTAGKTDFLNVTTAQLNLYTTENALAQSTAAVDTDLIALYKALGGGWEQAPLLPVVKEKVAEKKP
jgi:NodT family efflux transporter outer membrane factor (OMF) lipoprotein